MTTWFCHSPLCTWYRDPAECDCEELLMTLDPPALPEPDEEPVWVSLMYLGLTLLALVLVAK